MNRPAKPVPGLAQGPVVSIICPCLNGRKFLPDAIDSVVAQSFRDWELLIVDDGSEDGSRDYVISRARDEPRLSLIATQGRVGPAAARNVGLSAARGRFVAFLDCDDWWHADKLASQLEAMKASQASFSCGSYLVCDLEGAVIRVQSVKGPLTAKRALMKQVTIGCLTVMLDRASFPAARFPEHLKMGEDFALWYKLLKEGEQAGKSAVVMMQPLAYYRTSSGSHSANKVAGAVRVWKVYRSELGLPLLAACAGFLAYVVVGVFERRPRWLRKKHFSENVIGA